MKTLSNTDASVTKQNVTDVEFYGNGDQFKLLSKAFSTNEEWMKSTKAMQIDGLGCVVQISTQQGNNVAEALTYVPGAEIKEEIDPETGDVTGRSLVGIGVMKAPSDDIEVLASIQHAIWAHWMKYMFSCGAMKEDGEWVMPKSKVERWARQANTDYNDLSEKEKESDREVVRDFHLK